MAVEVFCVFSITRNRISRIIYILAGIWCTASLARTCLWLYNIAISCGGVFLMDEIRLDDVVQMRKTHPCGSDRWTVIRIGADIKIKCLGCGRIVMMDRETFVKRRKKTLEQGPVPEAETLRQMMAQG